MHTKPMIRPVKNSAWHYFLRWLGAGYDKLILWLTSKFFALGLALVLSFPKRYRMSHNNGIAGKGKLRIVDNPQFPEHDFFVPGRVFDARIRHAMATFLDDAMKGIRSCSIKFADTQWESPMDLECNTGEINLFWSAASFLKFAQLRKQQWGVEYEEYYRKYPQGIIGAQKALRKDATSYTNLRYYALTPFLFIGKDQIKRYAKYRVVPFDDIPETGLITHPSDWDTANQRITPHEPRGRNYLKDEFVKRVKEEGAHYRLQIQTRVANDDDNPEIFNNQIPWDEAVFPWHDLAIIDITEPLDWKESTLTSFSLNNMPKTLGIIPAKSIYDYNSLNYMRAHAELARKARLFSYKIKGFPPPIPDDDNRNKSDWDGKY
ncbi:MAG: hypothetical protein KGO92_06285 [Bacteroidota bacterium]|nr:hypothetical protein [Bacteroidota bacterium]